MASPIAFKPKPADPHQDLMRRLEAAPRAHAEALLVLFDALQTAHDKGLLDLVHGLMGGRDIIAEKLATAMKQPESLQAIRNAIAMGRVLGALDPELLQHVVQELEGVMKAQRTHAGPPPGWWSILRTVFSEDGRRGMWFVASVLAAMGRATKGK